MKKEISLLRKLVKSQEATIREQEVTIAQQQAENMRLKARVVSNRRQTRIKATPSKRKSGNA